MKAPVIVFLCHDVKELSVIASSFGQCRSRKHLFCNQLVIFDLFAVQIRFPVVAEARTILVHAVLDVEVAVLDALKAVEEVNARTRCWVLVVDLPLMYEHRVEKLYRRLVQVVSDNRIPF